jgi:hypothetical protein
MHAIVSSWIRAGRTLEEVESALLAPSDLSDEQRSALWLYAWALHERRARLMGPAEPLIARRPGAARPGQRTRMQPARRMRIVTPGA